MNPTRKVHNRFLTLLNAKAKRENRRISISEVSRELDVAYNTVLNWKENDLGKIEVRVLEGICEYFQCDIADLLYLAPVIEK